MTADLHLLALSAEELHSRGHIGNCNNCGMAVIDGNGMRCRCELGGSDFHFSDELLSQLRIYHKARENSYQAVLGSIEQAIIKPPVTPV